MSSVCLRCDWQGEGAGETWPRCGAPRYRPADPDRPRRATARAAERAEVEPPAAPPAHPPAPRPGRPLERDEDGAFFEPVRRTTSVRAVVAVAATTFAIVLALFVRGGPEPLGAPDGPAAPPPPPHTNRVHH